MLARLKGWIEIVPPPRFETGGYFFLGHREMLKENRATRPCPVKWSQKTGQSFKMYPKFMKGYENGEAPDFYRCV